MPSITLSMLLGAALRKKIQKKSTLGIKRNSSQEKSSKSTLIKVSKVYFFRKKVALDLMSLKRWRL